MMSSDGVAGMPPSFNYTPENMQNLQRVSVKLLLIIVDSVESDSVDSVEE